MKTIFTIFIFASFFACSNRTKDEIIINEIFIELTVEMYVHNDFLSNISPPPPPPPIEYQNDSLKKVDSMFYQKAIDNYRKQLNVQQKKGNNIVLAVGDSLILFNLKDLEYLKRNLPSKDYLEAFESLNETTVRSKRIDLNTISNTGNFELRYLSSYYPLNEIWESEKSYKFSGILQLSRIYLDEQSKHGIFYCSYNCGHLCGQGDIILIKNISGKWIIEKTIAVWIS